MLREMSLHDASLPPQLRQSRPVLANAPAAEHWTTCFSRRSPRTGRARQSSLIPAPLMTLAHFAISALMKAEKSADSVATGS